MSPTIRVLYVEDNPQDAELTRSQLALGAPDVAIEVAENGHAALERLRTAEYDVVLLDCSLPDIHGTQLMKELATLGVRTPVVMVTGWGDEDLVVQALRLGATDYVPKHGDYLTRLPAILRRAAAQGKRQGPGGQPAGLPRRHILYVEQNLADLDLLPRHLAEVAPYLQVTTSRSCAQALEMLGGPHQLDLVLTDLRMPDMSGLDFLREARHRGIDLPFIIISGRGDEETALAALKLGACDYLVKRQNYWKQLPYAVENALTRTQLDQANARLKAELSERQRREEERERLITAIEQAGDVVVITGPDGRVEYANPAFERTSGYGRAEVIGQHPRDRNSGAQSDAFYEALQQTLGDDLARARVLRRKDGRLYTEELTISPVRDAGGRIASYVAVGRDITERLRLEDQLRQAQKMETVGQLAGGVAHDFNNMLQVIISYAEMSLARVEQGQPLQTYLLEIRRAAQRSAEITAQLLGFARRQAVRPAVVDLNHALASARQMIGRLIGEDIELAWLPGRDLWRVKIDPAQLDQVLANLAVNSRDAIGGVGRLTIETANVRLDQAWCETHADLVPGDYVVLVVSDDGRGMDRETLSHVFEPFFTTKGPGEGTGLGLATVYGIVKQNKGSIRVYSEPGRGTTFKVYLPRVESEDAAEGAALDPEAPPGGSETVLVAEDEAAILELARQSLERLGYAVLTARSPEEAMQKSAETGERIDLLITDVVMPKMSGRQLAARLQTSRPGLRCLYMSGYTANVIADRGVLEAGVSFIAKPFSIAALAHKVREVLDAPLKTPVIDKPS